MDEPFTPDARWAHYVHRSFSPVRLGLLAGDTALEHFTKEPACWDSSAESYGLRYTRAFERRLIRNTAEMAAGLATGEDLRYRPSASHSLLRRLAHAVTSSTLAQMPDGSRRPAYTRWFAAAVSDISTAHWASRDVRPMWVAQSMGWTTLGQVQTNLLDEFGPDLKRVGANLWRRVRSKPDTAP